MPLVRVSNGGTSGGYVTIQAHTGLRNVVSYTSGVALSSVSSATQVYIIKLRNKNATVNFKFSGTGSYNYCAISNGVIMDGDGRSVSSGTINVTKQITNCDTVHLFMYSNSTRTGTVTITDN